MNEKLSTTAGWTKTTIGKATLTVHRYDRVRIPNSQFPHLAVEKILPDGQLQAGAGDVIFTLGMPVEIFCPHKYNK